MADEVVKQAGADSTEPARHELLVMASALASLEAGQLRRTINQITHVLRLSRANSCVPRLVLADAYMRGGAAAEARAQLQAVLELVPDFVPALYTLSEAETKLGKPQDAARHLERARELFPAYWKFRTAPGKQ